MQTILARGDVPESIAGLHIWNLFKLAVRQCRRCRCKQGNIEHEIERERKLALGCTLPGVDDDAKYEKLGVPRMFIDFDRCSESKLWADYFRHWGDHVAIDYTKEAAKAETKEAAEDPNQLLLGKEKEIYEVARTHAPVFAHQLGRK